MQIPFILKTLPAALLVLALAACGNDDSSSSNGVTAAAVVATASPDFQSGAVSLALTTPPYTAQNGLDGTTSDLFVRAAGDHFFLIHRFSTDTISRYAAAAPATVVYTYSTNDNQNGDAGLDSNPYDIIALSDTKAYLIRYGSSNLWIVNPSATSEANFKIGSIDLSAYAVNGAPQMSAGLIKNGKLYVAMQRLDADFAATQDAYVAVIDTSTDKEIATGDADAPLKGINLPVRDPLRLMAVPGSDTVLVVGDGGYDSNFKNLYNGGVASIDPDHGYITTRLVSDTDGDTHPYGVISDAAVATNGRAYFVGSEFFDGPANLYRFNPTSTAAPLALSLLQGQQLGPISADASGNLWVGRVQVLNTDPAPGLIVFGFANGTETTLEQLIGTTLNPLNIDFLSVPGN
jgi:hypothetical protein